MMTKIVYNACYGGFVLSKKAVERYWEIKGEPRPEHWWDDDLQRTDPILVQVVEVVGEGANGGFSYLNIRELPAGTLYRIDEHDGMEWVTTQDEYEWSVA